MKNNKAKISENLGRIFEIGFNIGILAYIEGNEFERNYGSFYRRDLQRIKLPTMVKRIAKNEGITSPESLKNLERWCQYFLQKGYLAGLNFFGEYISSTGWNNRRLKKPKEILYYQCSFRGDNSFGTYPKGDKYEEINGLLSQLVAGNKPGFLTENDFNNNLNSYVAKYTKKGEFLKADTLMLLRCGKDLRVLCVDLSIFSLGAAEQLMKLDDIENIRKMLFKDIKHLTAKSFFSQLRIDTGKGEDFGWSFSEDLKKYLLAFKREDKETAKLIQAGSYARSFYQFLLQETGIITANNKLVFNVVGYSDRNLSTISLTPENIEVLTTCSEIYQKEPKEREMMAVRREVLELIKINAAKSFKDGKKLIKELSEKPLNISGGGIAKVTYTEKIEGFFNSIGVVPNDVASALNIRPNLTLRNGHADLIKKALVGEDLFVFLTGNPGIGKTTAIATFLKDHIEEGFLLLYVSPRKQVNIDLIEKFADKNGNLSSDELFCLNTNSIVIGENYGKQTVKYLCNKRRDKFTKNNVDFLPIKDGGKIAKAITTNGRFRRENNELIKDVGKRTSGVLNSICQGIYTAIDKEISNNIVAAVSTQSLRITPQKATTLRHLEKIFQGAYNPQKGIMPEKMRAISKRIKHVFVMVDEITGDDSGVNFLHGVKKFFNEYELTDKKHGFNSKIIVADASIVEPQVIQQHLSSTSPEPDKIYFRSAKSGAECLSAERFNFGRKQGAIAINANSYPASSLNLIYKLFIQVERFEENKVKSSDNKLVKAVQGQILTDINAFLDKQKTGQLLVYIQDKRRLQELIEKIQKQRPEGFKEKTDYLEIHANLSEGDKEKINNYKLDAKVVFMTSSASRGLSFPKARHILVEIPRFQIERNLMEVIQVIYRARGEYWENGERKTLDNEDKEIIFYLGDRALYYPENDGEEKQQIIEESVINLLDILVILKLSIMTRIAGAGRLGRKDFMMIPIGGKSVAAAGNTFSGEMTNLIRELKNEHRRNPKKQGIKFVFESLQELLKRAEFVLFNSAGDEVSYLSLLESFNKEFPRLCMQLDKLLDFGRIETGHITGNLLVVPIKNQRLEETYEMRWEEQIRRVANNEELMRQMRRIIEDKDYAESLSSGIKNGAMELVKFLRKDEIDRTQWFEVNGQNFDQYYAIPLFVFICAEVMKEYLKKEANKKELEEEEETEFRSILSRYVHYLYPAYNTLPIGRKYREFPFLLFRSYSLEQMRENVFSDRYLLTSNELNVLNLILCKSGS
jgi:antitoxin component of MazEF toxin-antitoxin module